MDLIHPQADPGDPLRLDQEGRRLTDRLSTMSLVRLTAPMADGRTRAGIAMAAAQELADLAAELAGRPTQRIPDLPAHAVADVIAVMVHDLRSELAAGPGEASPEAGHQAQVAASAAAVDILVRLRRQL